MKKFGLYFLFANIFILSLQNIYASNPLDSNWRDYFVRRTLNPTGIVSTIFVDNSNLYIGGLFENISSSFPLKGLSQWQDSVWIRIGTETDFGTNGFINKIGKNEDLYIAGGFDSIGTIAARSIAKWTGSNWQVLGSGINGTVFSFAFKDSLLYAVGAFDTAGTVPAKNIAVWNFNNNNWLNIGNINRSVRSICVNNETELYVGGEFDTITKDSQIIQASHIAKYYNGVWSSLSNGMNGNVLALLFNNGLLYAGGEFTLCENDTVNHIAQWDGLVWQGLGSGLLKGKSLAYVESLAANDSVIYVGGLFATSGEITSNTIGIWSLTPLDPPLENSILPLVNKTNDQIIVEIFPNPINNNTVINVNVNNIGYLSIRITDVLGQYVQSFPNKQIIQGNYKFDIDWVSLNNGVYYCEVQFNNKRIIKKLIYLR